MLISKPQIRLVNNQYLAIYVWYLITRISYFRHLPRATVGNAGQLFQKSTCQLRTTVVASLNPLDLLGSSTTGNSFTRPPRLEAGRPHAITTCWGFRTAVLHDAAGWFNLHREPNMYHALQGGGEVPHLSDSQKCC